MQRSLVALVTGLLLLLCGGTASAMADDPAVQAAGQLAASAQSAEADATSTQQHPTNQNIDVRIFSPGRSGSVTQTNSSAATALAGNVNATTQSAMQAQGGGGTQAAEQVAHNQQKADADATSTQVKPTNTRISVRIGSPGDDGDVSQSNRATATGLAGNANRTEQLATQQSGGCCRGSGGTQVAGQQAHNRQSADGDATSTQVEPENTNISVRIGSPGDNGAVHQSNSSTATAGALNGNLTTQSATQSGGAICRCGSSGVQALEQQAASGQEADADATSTQVGPSNRNLAVRVDSPGRDGSVEQGNSSVATAKSGNLNHTTQDAAQVLGEGACACVESLRARPSRSPRPSVQAAGQFALNRQDADADATSTQVEPHNGNGALRIDSGGGGRGEVSQANDAPAYALAPNLNRLSQGLRQVE